MIVQHFNVKIIFCPYKTYMFINNIDLHAISNDVSSKMN